METLIKDLNFNTNTWIFVCKKPVRKIFANIPCYHVALFYGINEEAIDFLSVLNMNLLNSKN